MTKSSFVGLGNPSELAVETTILLDYQLIGEEHKAPEAI